MNALALSLTSSISSNEDFLIKGVVEGERVVLKKPMKTNIARGGEGISLSLCSLCEKNCMIF